MAGLQQAQGVYGDPAPLGALGAAVHSRAEAAGVGGCAGHLGEMPGGLG